LRPLCNDGKSGFELRLLFHSHRAQQCNNFLRHNFQIAFNEEGLLGTLCLLLTVLQKQLNSSTPSQAATRQHAKKDAKQRTLFVETHVTGHTSSCLIVFAVPSAIGGPAFATQRKKYQM
jgi:hypothetical protein